MAVSFKKMTGTWDVVEAKFETTDGNIIEPWGPSPIGMGIFTDEGYFSAQFMRSGRAKFAGEFPIPEEKQQTYDDYLAFYGRYSVDEEKGTVSIFIEGSTNANWIGEEQVRYCEIKDNNHVILRTPPLKYFGLEYIGTLAWKQRGQH
jgi:hypothetical protein